MSSTSSRTAGSTALSPSPSLRASTTSAMSWPMRRNSAGAEAARGAGRRAEADAGRDEGFFRIVGDGVLVAGDVGAAPAPPPPPCPWRPSAADPPASDGCPCRRKRCPGLRCAGSRPGPWRFRPHGGRRVLNSGCRASLKATALAAITCISGPPCRPGKIAELIFLAEASSLVRIRPPRGPRRDLWVVVVTTWAWGTGLGCTPPATRPAKCAMSTIR